MASSTTHRALFAASGTGDRASHETRSSTSPGVDRSKSAWKLAYPAANASRSPARAGLILNEPSGPGGVVRRPTATDEMGFVNWVAQRDAAANEPALLFWMVAAITASSPSAARARARRQSTIERAIPRLRTSGWTTSEWSRANRVRSAAEDDLVEFDEAESDQPGRIR